MIKRLWYLKLGLWCLFILILGISFYSNAAEVTSGEKGALTIRTEWFDRGNVVPGGNTYSDKYICLCTGGQNLTFVEFDVPFSETGNYELWGLYSANESRPLDLSVNGEFITKTFGQPTGSWMTSQAKWLKQADLTIKKTGINVFRFSTDRIHIPHLCALKFLPKFDKKVAWPVPRPIAKNTIVQARNWEPGPWSGGWYRPYAIDRYKKHESGETFSDHFGRETAIALVPEDKVSFKFLSPEIQLSEVNINDELTYVPTMFAPEEQEKKSIPAKADQAFTVQVTLPSTNDDMGDGQTRHIVFDVSVKRFEKLLDRIFALVKTIRDDEGDSNLLAANLTACQKLADKNKVFTEYLNAQATKNIRSLTEEPQVRQYINDYFAAIRLYWQTAMANPILDFDQLIFIKRNASHLGLPQNYESNSSLPRNVFHDRLMCMTLPNRGDNKDAFPRIKTFFKPDYETFLGDLDLHYDAEKLLLSSLDRERRWNVFELDLKEVQAGKSTDQVMKKKLPDFEDASNYDACYLPDESIIFQSSGCYIGVPCMQGTTRVTNTFRKNKDGSIRRLTFDQEHNWFPTVLEDGRILYLRWEYTDIPHVSGRILFQMNPDGTNQSAIYGSNCLWPVTMLYTKPIPGSTTKFITVVSGHHGVPRMGELVLFDIQKGRHDEAGAVTRICGSPKKIESRTNKKYYSTLTGDNIVDESWPKYLQPIPLSEDYYLVSAQPTRTDLWGIYLVDRHDNMILLAESTNYACFEPLPWRTTNRPPVIMDRVDLSKKDATVYVADLYFGEGLKKVPRGTVKNLRIFSYNYLYPGFGGWNGIVGVDGPWDVRQMLGTVPVNEDGSVLFEVPANVPIAIQPIDEHGAAVQQMRSWFTAMPGEFLSCTGCHEDKNSTSPVQNNAFVSKKEVAKIRPWYGPMRGFSYEREVQPVLDHYCIACHDGQDHGWGTTPFDLRGGTIVKDFTSAYFMGMLPTGNFSTSYINLARFVRRMGLESDNYLLNPMEFAPNTTELVQLLRDNHYGLVMDAEAWDRIITWIDMNAPYHGSWKEYAGEEHTKKWNEHRIKLLNMYANIVDDSETARGRIYKADQAGKLLTTEHSVIPLPLYPDEWQKKILQEVSAGKRAFPDGQELRTRFEKTIGKLDSQKMTGKNTLPGCESPQRENWNRIPNKDKNKNMELSLEEAVNQLPEVKRQSDNLQKIKLNDQWTLYLTKLPKKNGKTIWMGTFEVTNGQFEVFDPMHDSRVESRTGLSHGIRGFFVSRPELPVCRVSWLEADAFCKWLSKKTGKMFRLPTAEEWEYAAKAGTDTPFWYGNWNDDFSKSANLADQMLSEYVCDMYIHERTPLKASYYDDWYPKDIRFCDNGFVSERPGLYRPNPWGLFDMQGNVAEWTNTEVQAKTGIKSLDKMESTRIVCGGSWHDRPYRAASSFRTGFKPWQSVFDVGFRVMYEE